MVPDRACLYGSGWAARGYGEAVGEQLGEQLAPAKAGTPAATLEMERFRQVRVAINMGGAPMVVPRDGIDDIRVVCNQRGSTTPEGAEAAAQAARTSTESLRKDIHKKTGP